MGHKAQQEISRDHIPRACSDKLVLTCSMSKHPDSVAATALSYCACGGGGASRVDLRTR